MPRRSELFTEDPYYLPRYCGYLPQYKYRIGKTYGRHSVEILTDPEVRKSGRYVLTDTEAPVRSEMVDERRQVLRSREDSFGNQNYTDRMIPGYTGYIPKNQHYFANSYAEVCRSSLAHHEVEQRNMQSARAHTRKIHALQTGTLRPTTDEDKKLITARYQTPLKQHLKDARPYQPPKLFRPAGSPYFMENANDMKWFKSGYTGFVPRTRELIAMTYPQMTNKGLNKFSHDISSNKANAETPVQLTKREFPRPPKTIIYPTNLGMLPHYTGYIPGYKYQIGHTYGRHTHNTMKIHGNKNNQKPLTTVT